MLFYSYFYGYANAFYGKWINLRSYRLLLRRGFSDTLFLQQLQRRLWQPLRLREDRIRMALRFLRSIRYQESSYAKASAAANFISSVI